MARVVVMEMILVATVIRVDLPFEMSSFVLTQ